MTSPPEILMPQRPRSDRPLDDRIALAALREQFPAERFQRVTLLGSGWATDAYLVDDDLVACFPRNAELAQGLDRDEALLRFVTSSLGAAFAVPEVRHRGRAVRGRRPDVPDRRPGTGAAPPAAARACAGG